MFFDNQSELNLILNESINQENDITNIKDGLIKGNMFNKEYKSYNNIKPKSIEALDDKTKLLLKIYELDFAIIDLGLYLDLNQNDNKTYELYKTYVKNYKDLKEKYEQLYNILCQTSTIKETYTWPNNPWPFETMGGIKYV